MIQFSRHPLALVMHAWVELPCRQHPAVDVACPLGLRYNPHHALYKVRECHSVGTYTIHWGLM